MSSSMKVDTVDAGPCEVEYGAGQIAMICNKMQRYFME